MSASSSTTAAADSPGSIEALKRVRATEIDWEQRLQAAQQQAAAEIARLRAEADAAIKAAQSEADQERARKVQAARADADREAAGILADGERAANDAAKGEGRRPVDRADAIRAAVLAGFLGD
ncbi:MAG TPA: hypothetical protein VMG14_02985 [Thermoplasmata archaeon]|nr:hypothetical protein [Thermoplasmata archaeon]